MKHSMAGIPPDCFVASLLAMTEGASLRTMKPGRTRPILTGEGPLRACAARDNPFAALASTPDVR